MSSFPVTPGEAIQAEGLRVVGNDDSDRYPGEDGALKPGQPANTVRLGDNLKRIQKLTDRKGYVTAAIKPKPHFDEAADTVAITLRSRKALCFTWATWNSADSTTAYREAPKCLEDPSRRDLRLHLPERIPSRRAQTLLPPTLDWEVSPHVTANVRDKTVDVDLIYSAKAPK